MNREIKAGYLGRVAIPIQPDLQTISCLTKTDSVVNVYCSNCGGIVEVDAIGAEELMKHLERGIVIAGLTKDFFKQKYFRTDGCVLCKVATPKVTLELIRSN